jgi:hypothetical protein
LERGTAGCGGVDFGFDLVIGGSKKGKLQSSVLRLQAQQKKQKQQQQRQAEYGI